MTLQKKIDNGKSLFCKIVDFMESEGFKHTDQTVDGQDIFERGDNKIIIVKWANE